jgi:hypothetical protein
MEKDAILAMARTTIDNRQQDLQPNGPIIDSHRELLFVVLYRPRHQLRRRNSLMKNMAIIKSWWFIFY